MVTSISKPLKVGIVNFINTAPLYVPWKRRGNPQGWKTLTGPPAALNALLRRAKLQAGLVSSFEYGENFNSYIIMDNLSISAKGAVKSVILVSDIPISQFDAVTIIVTPKSATSIMLLRIILTRFYNLSYGRHYVFQKGDLEMARLRCCPYLSIGDEALILYHANNYNYIYDLAEIWLKKTSLPFVFAVMALREDCLYEMPYEVEGLYRHIGRCIEDGLSSIEDIGRLMASKMATNKIGKEEIVSYLKGIDFSLSTANQEGLSLYLKMLHEMGLLREEPAIKLYGV